LAQATQLTHLSFFDTEFEPGAVAAMFEAAAAAGGGGYPAFARLEELSFKGCREIGLMRTYSNPLLPRASGPSGGACDGVCDSTAVPFKAVPCSSLSLLTGSCPHLRCLSIVDSLWCDGSIAALLSLQNLGSLCIDGSGDITDAAVSSVLAGMTGLREL
jgi:hypothetical protein